MESIELRLPPDPVAAALARAAVADLIGSGLPEAVASDAELLTSEVVSNALQHAGLSRTDALTLRLMLDSYLRVEVVDPGPPFELGPPLPHGVSGSPGGFGLAFLEAMATAWGVEPEGTGKKVWFEIGPRQSNT
jgi:anti-sigma regulatory factor (Ser/Thr protein kinase)